MSVYNPNSDRIFMKSRRIPIRSDCRIESPGGIQLWVRVIFLQFYFSMRRAYFKKIAKFCKTWLTVLGSRNSNVHRVCPNIWVRFFRWQEAYLLRLSQFLYNASICLKFGFHNSQSTSWYTDFRRRSYMN
jgi:hypothetical protein